MLILAWLLVRGLWALLVAVVDGLFVIVHLKWYPAMGRARWRWQSIEERCLDCDGKLAPCDCHPGCIGGMCPACERRSRS